MSSFWSGWIIVLTVISFVGITWILFANRTRANIDEATTGHVYDGIEEYDNPMPAWWLNLFVITIVFGVGYLIAYPGLGNFAGLLGWTQKGQWESEVAKAEERFNAAFAPYAQMAVEDVIQDPKAMKMGQRLFANNCAVCHGSDARGAFGFPNLTDREWLYGGSPDQIKTSITHGRRGAMPSWAAALGSEQAIADVADYVISLNNPGAAAVNEAGQRAFATFCVACHGADGKGNVLFGAPNLSNDTWLYGGTRGDIIHTIKNGRNGVMPAHLDTLSADKIHLLTAYVYKLSQ